jgi:hypothetical protein
MGLRKIVNNPGDFKAIRRYVIAADNLIKLIGTCDESKVKIGSLPNQNRREILDNLDVLISAKQAVTSKGGISLPTEDEIKNGDLTGTLKTLQRKTKTVEDCADAELVKTVKVKAIKEGKDIKVIETEEDPEFIIEVYKRNDIAGPLVYQSQVCNLDGTRVCDLFYRSKSEYISLNHFGKTAVRHHKISGQWPAKIGAGITL